MHFNKQEELYVVYGIWEESPMEGELTSILKRSSFMYIIVAMLISVAVRV